MMPDNSEREAQRAVWIDEWRGRKGLEPITEGPYLRVHGYAVEMPGYERGEPFRTKYVPATTLEAVTADRDALRTALEQVTPMAMCWVDSVAGGKEGPCEERYVIEMREQVIRARKLVAP